MSGPSKSRHAVRDTAPLARTSRSTSGCRLAIGEHDGPAPSRRLDERKMAARSAARRSRRRTVVPPREADQAPHLREVSVAVRDGNEPSARTHDPRQLARGPCRDRARGTASTRPRATSNDSVFERQLLDVADAGLDSARHAPARPCAPTGRARRRSRVELRCDPLGQLALAAADLEDALRLGLSDRLERDVACVDGPADSARSPSAPRGRDSSAYWRRTYLGIVRRGTPPSRLDDRLARHPLAAAALPPSHGFTVAPTSANSPSWIRPAAFLP